MCNFIIRPIKCYATVDLDTSDGKELIKKGDSFQVVTVAGEMVVGEVNGVAGLSIPLNVFIHTFSDKDPNAKDNKSK